MSLFIRYIGSPYQTTLSEAGQIKYLYCMDSKYGNKDSYEWKEVERWPIDIGRKYFKVSDILYNLTQ